MAADRADRKIPRTRDELIRMIQRAMENQPRSSEPINDEHLALLCEGDLDALGQEDRERLLKQVAAEPWAAELVVELRAAGWGAKSRGDIAGSLIRLSPWGWTLAACLVIALGVWRVVQPPVLLATGTPAQVNQPPARDHSQVANGDGGVIPSNPTNAGNEQDNTPRGHFVGSLPATQGSPNAVAVPRGSLIEPPGVNPPSVHMAGRDMALWIALGVLLLLTIPAVYWFSIHRQLRRLVQL